MTNVQEKSIPAILTGQDVVIKSQTGSGERKETNVVLFKDKKQNKTNIFVILGKTLAYVVPLIHQIQKIEPVVRRETGPIAIVLVPTKEVRRKH